MNLGVKTKSLVENIKGKLKNDKKQFKNVLIALSLLIVLGITAYITYQKGFSYQVDFNGQLMGYVKEETEVTDALELVEEKIKKEYGEKAYFHKDIETERVRGHNKDIIELEELGQLISQNIGILRPATVIIINGIEEVIVDSHEIAEGILEALKEPYLEKEENDDIEVLNVSFGQNIDIVTKDVPVGNIMSREAALLELEQTKDDVQKYQIARGDTAWNISRSLNIGMSRLESANPGKDMEKLQPGEEINLNVAKPIVDIISVEKHKNIKDIDFKTEKKNDSSIYTGQQKVDQEGKKGKKEVITEVTFTNGIVTERNIIEETVLEEPVNKIIAVGTKARPKPTTPSRGGGKTAPTYNGERGAAIAKTAQGYIGVPYVYGGSTPSGFDCSGLTSYVYRQYGISLPRTSGAQANFGTKVSRSQLKPGDIVAFPGHVGIYIGGGKFVHAPSPGKRVEIASLNSGSYSRRFITGRRPY